MDPHKERISIYDAWVPSSPHPHSSSLAPHPDQPEFTPVQDELEALELWGSGIWQPQEKFEDLPQKLLGKLIQEECHYVVCMLPLGGLFPQPKSPPWIFLTLPLLLTKKLYFLKIPLIYDPIALISLCYFNGMPDYLFFWRRVLKEKLAKNLNSGIFSVLNDLKTQNITRQVWLYSRDLRA